VLVFFWRFPSWHSENKIDRDGLLVTSVGRGLACNWTLCTQTTHWQCAAVRNKWGLKKIRCCIGTSGHLIACHAGSVAKSHFREQIKYCYKSNKTANAALHYVEHSASPICLTPYVFTVKGST
jgi:hypothetical protein